MWTFMNDQVWNDVARALGDFEEMRRRVSGLLENADLFGPDLGHRPAATVWPRADLYDDGERYVLEAVVPGLTEKDLSLSLNRNVVTIEGARELSVPEGYSLQRRERGSVKFSRSLSLPGPVDPEKASAQVRDGLLTVTLPKAPEARPKQIAVESA